MSKLTKEDQETLITMDADNRAVWKVYTSDPVFITKLNKIAEPTRSDDWGNHYEVDARQVLLRKVPKRRTSAKSLANLKNQR